VGGKEKKKKRGKYQAPKLLTNPNLSGYRLIYL